MSQRGFTLVSVLAALAILVFGLLALARAYINITMGASQNQNVNTLSNLGNQFWGVVQANPGVVTSMAGTFNSTNCSAAAGTCTGAPTALNPWLMEVIFGAGNITSATTGGYAFESASVTIVTAPDVATGNPCSATACAATVTITWTQNAVAGVPGGSGVTRSQQFNYQFGL